MGPRGALPSKGLSGCLCFYVKYPSYVGTIGLQLVAVFWKVAQLLEEVVTWGGSLGAF